MSCRVAFKSETLNHQQKDPHMSTQYKLPRTTRALMLRVEALPRKKLVTKLLKILSKKVKQGLLSISGIGRPPYTYKTLKTIPTRNIADLIKMEYALTLTDPELSESEGVGNPPCQKGCRNCPRCRHSHSAH